MARPTVKLVRRASRQAFDSAIEQGRLSLNPRSITYVRDYLYRGTVRTIHPDGSVTDEDRFKHRDGRDFLP